MTVEQPSVAPPRTSTPPDYEVVIVAYRSGPMVRELLAELPAAVPVAVVDNSHDVDGVRAMAENRPLTRYLDGPGRGFPVAANLAISGSAYDYVVIVDPDCRPSAAQLDTLVADLRSDPRLAIACATSVLSDGRVEFGIGGWEPSVGRALVHAVGAHKLFPRRGIWARPEPGSEIELDWLGGACLALSKRLFHAVGGFDEGYFVYNEDVELGRRVREAGLRQILRTDVLIAHREGGSGDSPDRMVRVRGASMSRYLRRHNSARVATAIRVAFTVGGLARAALHLVRGRTSPARQNLVYLKGLWWGGDRPTTPRDTAAAARTGDGGGSGPQHVERS